MVSPLDTAVTKLWRLELFSCTSSSLSRYFDDSTNYIFVLLLTTDDVLAKKKPTIIKTCLKTQSKSSSMAKRKESRWYIDDRCIL